jgi:hypothetical protein
MGSASLEDRPINLLDPSTGGPILHKMPGKPYLMLVGRNIFLSFISVTILPIVLIGFAFIRFSDMIDVIRKVFFSPHLTLLEASGRGREDKVWGSHVGRCYAKALEYQQREGFCSSTTMRCMLRSYNVALPTEKQVAVPPAVGKPDTPEGVRNKLLALCVTAKGSPQLQVTLCRGSEAEGATQEEHYQAFLEQVRLVNHPSGMYRVGANFLRGAIFGAPSFWPATAMLVLLGGHFSPVVGFFEGDLKAFPEGPLVALFDVNDAYGLCLIPARRMFEAVHTIDLFTGSKRGLVVTKLLTP